MAIIQTNKIMNSLVGQAIGRTDLIGSDASFVSLGDEILSSQNNVESIYNVLVERIGMTISSVRAMRSHYSKMRRNPMEWGVVLQKLSMPLNEATNNPSWDGVDIKGDGGVLSPANTNKPIQKLFNKVSTWEYSDTIWNKQLRFAFEGANQAMAFLNMIFTNGYNSQEMGFRALDRTCRNSLMAYTVGTSRDINIREMYNNMTGKNLTREEYMQSPDALIHGAQIIDEISTYMEEMSRTFNDGTMDRHTPKDLQIIQILTQFSKAMQYVARSNVYHDNLIVLPNFEEVNFWQGTGTTTESANAPITTSNTNLMTNAWNIDNTSKIDVIIGENANKEIETDGIVAMICDFEALGTTVQGVSTSTSYNPRRKFTNYYMQADMGYYNDTSENCVIFRI